MMDMFFIKVTDAISNNEMLIRGDLVFKIEEYYSDTYGNQRRIQFMDGSTEYVKDTMQDLINSLVGVEENY